MLYVLQYDEGIYISQCCLIQVRMPYEYASFECLCEHFTPLRAFHTWWRQIKHFIEYPQEEMRLFMQTHFLVRNPLCERIVNNPWKMYSLFAILYANALFIILYANALFAHLRCKCIVCSQSSMQMHCSQSFMQTHCLFAIFHANALFVYNPR